MRSFSPTHPCPECGEQSRHLQYGIYWCDKCRIQIKTEELPQGVIIVPVACAPDFEGPPFEILTVSGPYTVTDLTKKSTPPVSEGLSTLRGAKDTHSDGRRFITIKDAAALTALSRSYLSKLCDRGVIETNGIKNRGRRIDAGSLAEFMRLRNEVGR
jgi:hypothetical protein